jgi:hypothetical protein
MGRSDMAEAAESGVVQLVVVCAHCVLVVNGVELGGARVARRSGVWRRGTERSRAGHDNVADIQTCTRRPAAELEE